jgi:hypothetical protein
MKMRIKFLIVRTLVFLAVSLSLPAFANKIAKQKPPPFLFHWMRESSTNIDYKLKSLAKDKLPLPWMYNSYNLVKSIPSLQNGSGLFAWSHPIGGFATGPTEIYGDFLIAIEMPQSPVRVWEIKTSDASDTSNIKTDFSKFDLIHHIRTNPNDASQTLYEEWIITNSKIVESFTADPAIIRPIVRMYRKAMTEGLYFKTEQLHAQFPPNGRYKSRFLNSDYARSTYVFPILDSYINADHEDLHPSWRRSFDHCGLLEFLSADLGSQPN